ncbi:MAG TPA: hypothetical protein VL588_08360 [Bdellovibrionota bacterium]|jgi:anti-anti-sigma regulatory factor|nr:hypothetical protein [Bdellovibrionota bacterium]
MSPEDKRDQPLQYFIAEQGPVQIVSLVGQINRENEPVLQKCVKEILGRNAAWVIFNFRDISLDIDRKMFRILVQAQKTLREKPKVVRICGLHPELYAQLVEQGVIRQEEVFANVAEVIAAIQAG